MAKALNDRQFGRLLNTLSVLDDEQLGRIFSAVIKRKSAPGAAAASTADAFLGTKEAADLVRVSDETVRRWAVDFGIGRQISGVWVISGSLLEALIQSGRVVSPTRDMPDAPRDEAAAAA
jgi:hypothetical protein